MKFNDCEDIPTLLEPMQSWFDLLRRFGLFTRLQER